MKRHRIPKNWPLPKKGNKYIVKPRFGEKEGLPILVILRDILGIAQTRKEVKRAIHLNKILINGRGARDEKNTLVLFDTISLVPMKKYYRLELDEKGKFALNRINEKDAIKKVAKIRNKKILKGKKTQINLSDGRNFLSDIKCNTGDSVIINLEDKKIEKCLPLDEKANVLIFSGKHAGKKGKIKALKDNVKMAEVETIGKEKDKINVLTKQLIVIE